MALKYLENSYVTLDSANKYFADRVGASTWVALSNDEKEDLLVTATRTLDQEIWTGVAVSTSQLLAWPRSGSYYEPKQGYQVSLDETSAPLRVQEATFELALHYMGNPDSLKTSSSVDSLKVGSIELTGIRASSKTPSTSKTLYKPLLVSGGSHEVWRAW